MRNLPLITFLAILVLTFSGCPKKQTVQPVEVPVDTVAIEPEPEPEPEPVKPVLVLDRIFFDYDKSDIRQDAATILQRNAEMLKLYPEVNVLIEGHCCEMGTSEYNLALGERRANAARDYLLMLGLTPDRLSTVSYGEEKPFDPTDLPKNRRCEFKPR